ncbi:unnamed protein product [Closterium sp. NIES-65]|nr:unnamed protein product [Closterium sp. NIES-65]
MAFGDPEAVRVTGEVRLSADESHLFSTLRDVVSHYGLGTQLRVAGGWVRDKLIGRDCIDIDIALDNLLGREFAEKVTEYLKERGEVVRGVGVIQKNPDQSKHLETATMMIHGMWIDFVNLRAEEYAHDSRIPHTIEFGTAEEDALRRDLTINSMFYNISTEQIEDPTGRGIADLNGGIIRTPLPPHQTFLDDPLRVLRAVRFAARFGFSLDEELRAAAASEEVRTALGNKVSKERIGKEVELMLKSRDPYAAISLVVDLNLFPTVFPLPHALSHTADVPPDDELPGLCEASFAATCTRLHQWEKHLPQALIDHLSDLSVGLLLAALLMPLRHAHYLDKKKKEVPFAQHIVLDSLKLKRAYADMVVLLHAAAEDFTALAPLLATAGAEGAGAAVGGVGDEARALTLIQPPHEEFRGNPRVLAGALGAGRCSAVQLELAVQCGWWGTAWQVRFFLHCSSAFQPPIPEPFCPFLFSIPPSSLTMQTPPQGKLLRKVKGCWPSAVLLASTLPLALKALLPKPPLLPPFTQIHLSFEIPSPPSPGKLLRKVKGCWPSAVLLASTLPPVSSAARSEQCGREGEGAKGERGEGEREEEDCKRRRMEGKEGGAGEDVGSGRKGCEQSEFYLQVLQAVHAMGLDGVWDTKPILNGRDVVAALELKKGDPRTGYWMDRVMEWQLANPDNGSTEEFTACRGYRILKRVKNIVSEPGPHSTRLSPLLGRPKALAAMLAIFQKSIGEAPQELMAPKLNRSASMSGRLDAKEILHGFKKAHPGAVLMQFDEQHAIAYTHDMQDFLMPRQFAACDDVFCAFAGNIENLAQLRQRYGLDRHVSEVNLIIEAYKTLRDRRPYPPDQVIADLAGAFAFVLYDNKAKTVFVAHDAQGKVPLYWGKCLDDGVLAFSDDPAVLKAGTGSSFAPFPLGCFYSSDGGLRSFTDPEKQLKAIQHIDSQGELCGATFKVDSQQDLTQMPLDSKDDSGRGWS